MQRRVLLSTAIIIAISVVGLTPSLSAVMSADGHRAPGMAVVVADLEALNGVEKGADLASSMVGLIMALQDDQPITLITVDDPSFKAGPVRSSEEGVRQVQELIGSWQQPETPREPWLMAVTLERAYDILADAGAASGSAVYLLTSGPAESRFGGLTEHLIQLSAGFRQNGWTVNSLSLPQQQQETVELFADLSKASGGHIYPLDAGSGFKLLADDILRDGTRGALSGVGEGVLERQDVLTSVVGVAPGTRETTLLFFKENPFGSLRLNNPSGFDVSLGDRTASYVLETPHAIIWRLVDPAPGNWRIDARGMDGFVTAWAYSSNKYSIALSSAGPLPLNEPSSLVAHVYDGETVVALPDALVYVHITTPDGTTLVHPMNDDGVEGDATAGDGHFSLRLPPLTAEGEYKVELRLTWPDYQYRITTQSSFDARLFPGIEVRTEQLDSLKPGQRAKVATVFVHIDGSPHPVSPDQLEAAVASQAGTQAEVEVVPRRLYGDGPAWEYDVFVTPQEGRHTLIFRVALEYAGRKFTEESSSLVVSAFPPPAPVMTVPAPAPAAPPPTSRPVQAQPQVVPTIIDEPGLAWKWFVALLVLLIAVSLAAFLITHPRPQGYLYDDKDEPLVDFGKLRRHPLLSLLFPGIVRGKELEVPGLEGVEFRFSRNQGITIRSVGEHPTVRVNNQPLVEPTSISDRAWIGTRGKLYSFLTAPSPTQAEAGAD